MEIDQLRELFEGIRDENRRYANTATRIGNAFLALLSYIGTPGQDKYIRKDIEDFASGHISFNDGLSIPTGKAAKIGAGSITWDSANNCFHFSHGIYSDDFISALGISNGMSSGGSFDLLQEWNKYVEDTAKSMALSAYLGKDLLDRVTSLEKGQKGHKITISGSGDVLVNVAESSDGSTLTFTKGNIDLSGYATKTELTELLTAKADKSIRVSAGTGLAGGGSLSADITLSLATVGTAGTYTKVTVDKYGRVTGHSSLTAADIPTLEISKINGLQAELDKKLNKTDFGDSFAAEMAKWFAKDSEGNIYVADEKGFYSNSFISALGLSASTGGGGSFDLLQDWNKYVDETAKSTALSAYLGKDLLDRIKAVENERKGHAIVVSGSGNVLVNVAESSDGSTLTFTKGNIDLSGYATTTALAEVSKKTDAITTKVNDFLEGTDTDGIINKWKELEAFLDGQTQTSTLAELLAVKADKSIRVNTGTGLAGGGSLSADITLSLATVGTAGTYTKVTVDKYGRVTGHSSLTAADIPTLEISKINGLQAELDKKLNKTDFGASFATEMAKWFAKDSDGNIYVANEKGFYSNSFISALGLSDSEGGTGGTNYDRLDSWSDYSSDKATWVLSALLGHELNSRVSALEAGGATSVVTSGSGNVVTAVTKSGTVITATKGITALTSHQNIYALTIQGNGSTIGTYNPKSANATINITPANIGAATSGHKHTISILTDLGEGWDALLEESPSAYVTRWPAFSEISGKPSTLAGYGITDGVNGVTVTGNGNAVTTANVSGHTLTLTKGSTFLLSSAYTAADILSKLKTVDGSGSGLDADLLDGVHLDGLFTGLSWSTQTLSITIGGVSKTVNIPYATASVAGLVSTGTQTFGGLKTFNSGLVVPAGKSLKIGDGTITWDSDKGCFHFSNGLYSDEFVSALGLSASTGGGGTSYDRLDAWGDYDSSKASWVLSAKLGYDLNTRLKSVEAGSATSVVMAGSGNAVTSITKSGTVITATKGSTFLLSSAYTAADILSKLKTVDGSGSGLDADLLDGTHKSGLLTALSSSATTNLSITVGGTTKSIADLYATQAVNADTLDNVHLNGIFTGFSANGNSTRLVIGGVTKDLTVPYATSAGKWATTRSVTLGCFADCSFSINGSANVNFDFVPYNFRLSVGNKNNYPWHRIAKIGTISNAYYDAELTLLLSQGYDGGYVGIVRIALRTNNTGTASSAKAEWLLRKGFAADSVKIGIYNVFGSTYADVFLHSNGSYASTTGVVLTQGGRGYAARRWTLVDSSEVSDTTASDKLTSYECWASIESAATDLHGKAYSQQVTAADSATVKTANQLTTSRSINGTSFDGTANITTAKWGTARNIYIRDASQAHTGAAVSVDGSATEYLLLPSTITATLVGNADTATELQTPRTINGTYFSGVSNITTSYWGVSRKIYIQDATEAHTGAAVSVNGSANVNLKLPSTITATLVGNASTATKLRTARTLWGRSFDGTANVSGSLSGVGTITGSGTLALVGNDDIYLKRGGVDSNSLVLSGNVFKPFNSANNNIDLGSSSTKWRNLYVAGTANVGSITIGSGKITWDSAKGCFHFSHGLYSDSFVSALGANSSASGGGGSYERLDSWSDYSSDKATWVLSALLGHELNSRVSALEAGGATSVVTSGSGNVVTAVTKSGTVITATKGITALTSHQAIYALTLQGNGSTIGKFNPKSANATINLTAKNLLLGRGLQNPQTGRTQNFGRLYSYYTSGSAHENAPTTYTAVIGFGSDDKASVEIAGGWTSGMGLWYRALRDVEDDWFGWRKVLDESNYASVLDSRYYTESEINTKLTNGSVTKLGTATVGGTAKPVYLNAGTATALSATVGSSTRPVYLNAGTITQCGTTLGVSVSGGATYLSKSNRLDYGWNGLNYFNADLDAGCAAKVNDSPTSAWWHILRFNHANSSGYYTDLAIPFNSDSIYWKTVRNGSLAHSAWAKVLDSLNYTSYTVTKTGSGASGTWGIGISGNAATASKWQTARTLSLTGAVTGSASIDGSGNVSINTTYATGNISSLDSRYVNVSGDTMTGLLTVSGGSHKGVKVGSCYISAIDNALILQNCDQLRFGGDAWNWNVWGGLKYDGDNHNLYLGAPTSAFSGNVFNNNGYTGWSKLYLTHGINEVYMPHINTSSTTVVSNLNADLLDGTHKSGLLTALSSSATTNLSITVGGTTKSIADLYATQAVNADTLDNLHASSFLRCDGTNSIALSGGNGNTAGWRLVMEKTCGGWTICNIVFSVTSRHTGQGVMNIGFHTTNEEGTSYAASINLFGSTASNGSSPWRAFYNTSTKKFRLFWYYNDYNRAQINVLSRSGFNAPTNGTWYEALPSDNGTELTIYYNNAATATKLLNARNINGTSFNGTADITTAKWGTARNIYIRDASQAHTGAAVSVDGSATEYLLLPSTITATLVGNASSATKLATARTINGTSFDGTENITTAKWGTARTIYIQDASGAHGSVGVSVDGSTNYNLKLPSTITATLSGNASTATKLRTARTLWGRSFDGSANVSGDMTGVGNVTPSANGTLDLGTATSRWANMYTNCIEVYGTNPVIRFHYNNSSSVTDFIGAASNGLITISNVLRIYQSSGVYVDKGEFHVAGKVVIGSTPSTYVLNVQGEIGVTGTYGGMRIIPGYASGEAFRIDPITSSGASNSNRITLLQNGNVCIGGPTTTSYKLDVSGTIYSRANIIAAGAVTALVVSSSSDARLKNIIRDACPAVEDVADAPAVEFAWKKDGSRAVGSIAQYWQGVLPQAVHEERGYLAMQYDVIAMLASIANARRILSIEKKIRELEEEVKRLKTA